MIRVIHDSSVTSSTAIIIGVKMKGFSRILKSTWQWYGALEVRLANESSILFLLLNT